MSREITEAQRAWLAAELDAWREGGVVSAEQVGAVLALYGTPEEALERRQSNALLTLLSLAGLLVGLGVMLLIGYNWSEMSAAAKVVAVLGGVVAAHGAGFWLRFQAGLRRISEAAFFFGCLLYGAGIWLLAQVFHVSAHDPDGFWWWALGVLPFALALDTLVMHALLVGLLAAWAGWEVFGYADLGAWPFGRSPWLPNGAYSLLVLAAPGVWWAYRRRSPRALGLYLPLIAWWVILQPFAWHLEVNPVYFIGAVGGLLLLAAEAHPEGSPMAIPYRLFGAGLFGGALVPLSFHGFNAEFGGARVTPTLRTLQMFYQTLAIVVLAGAVLAVVVAARRRSRPLPWSVGAEAWEVVRRQWLPGVAVAVMAGLSFWNAVGGAPLLTTLAANVAMVVLGLWLTQVGLRQDRGRPFAAGVLYFLFWAVLRYIDLFGAFGGMLGAAAVFFFCGLALFGVALFWRRRKVVLHA